MNRHAADPSTSGSDSSPRGRPSRRLRAIRTLVVALVIAATVGLVAPGPVGAATADRTASAGNASSGADPSIVVADATLEADETTTQRVALTEAPDGLAGFELTLAVADADVATVADASYPDHFGLTTDPDVSAEGHRITVEAADLGDEISDGATDVALATIDAAGADAGETELRVTDLQVDADGGDPVDPSLEAGTLTVGDGSSETGSESADGTGSGAGDSDGDDPSDDDSDALSGFAIGPAIAAVAVLATALLARRG